MASPNACHDLTPMFYTCTLKLKCCHFDEKICTGCTRRCHLDNFLCIRWLKFHQNDDISDSVYLWCATLERVIRYIWIVMCYPLYTQTSTADSILWLYVTLVPVICQSGYVLYMCQSGSHANKDQQQCPPPPSLVVNCGTTDVASRFGTNGFVKL